MTVCCLEVPVAEAANTFGVMQIDASGRVVGFAEKPAQPAEIPGKPGMCLASMGNYIFNTQCLHKQLIQGRRGRRLDARLRPRCDSRHVRLLPCAGACVS